jgi:hypothetical protein
MGVIVELQTDSFSDVLAVERMSVHTNAGVRRPFRGIEIKEDTYAVMKVMQSNGNSIPLVDSGGDIPASGMDPKTYLSGGRTRSSMTSTVNYSNFIIQQITDNRQEKSQILETFGDPFIFFFGERPRILQVSGLLMNTRDFNWRTEFWYNYERYLRGTKLVELNARIYLFWDDILVEGYMLGAQAQDDANLPYHIPFTFTLFVTNHTYLSSVGDDAYPVTSAVPLSLLRLEGADKVETAMKDLRGKSAFINDYESNVDLVRAELEKSEEARKAKEAASVSGKIKSFMNSPAGQKLNASKNLVAGALAIGLRVQNLTFLSIVNHFFKNRKLLFPRGMAGSDAYAGAAVYANQPEPFDAFPRRTKALRSKIRDNVDEYVGHGSSGWEGTPVWDQEAIDAAEEGKMFASEYDLEKKALMDLKEMGIEPIQHPGGSPFTHGIHGIRAFGASEDMKKLSSW